MNSIYTALYVCKSMKSVGIPGYHEVFLGLPGDRNSDIVVKGTCSSFEIGKEYFITITETEV